MADSSFDVVSKLDRQEVDNAVNQTAKEIANRYDFRGVDAAITLSGDTIAMEANSASRVMAILDVLQSKLIRRGLSLKVLDYKDREPKASGKLFKLACPLKEGIPQDTAKKISKLIREEGPKGAKPRFRVTNFAFPPSPETTCRPSSPSSRAPRVRNWTSRSSL